jgi:tetratricopeptide (TPR) repeat protein
MAADLDLSGFKTAKCEALGERLLLKNIITQDLARSWRWLLGCFAGGDFNFARAHSQLGMALLEKGQYDEALAEISIGASGAVSVWLGHAYARAGKRAQAEQQLAAQLDQWRSSHTDAFGIASTYVGLGDKDEAFAWLEKDLRDGAYMIKAWPYWDPLRSDPRYQDLLRRIGLSP